MAVASRVPLARVNSADVIIVPLVEPGEGQRCDLPSTLFPQKNAYRAPSPSPQPSPLSWPRAHDTLLACPSSSSVISLLALKRISCSSPSTTSCLATMECETVGNLTLRPGRPRPAGAVRHDRLGGSIEPYEHLTELTPNRIDRISALHQAPQEGQ